MSSGAKISLMIIAAVLGLLAVYYGLISRSDDPLSPDAQATPGQQEAALDPNGSETDLAGEPGAAGGVITESLNAGGTGPDPKNQIVMDPLMPATEPTPGSPGAGAGAGADQIAANAPASLPGGQAPLGHDPSQARMPDIPGFVPADQPRSFTTPPGPSVKGTAGGGGGGGTLASSAAYIVKEGDNLWSIAQQWFGDGGKWDLIAKANPSVNPDQLRVGTKLSLPAKDATRSAGTVAAASATGPAATTGLSTNAPVSTAATYTVASGDTLTSIARDLYGDIGKWKIIYDANKTGIGSDPNELKVGMKLTIPPQTPRTAAARN